MKELGADLPVHYAATEGFRSVQLINPPVAIRVALFYRYTSNDKDLKTREKDVTDEAYIVSFDPRVAIARALVAAGPPTETVGVTDTLPFPTVPVRNPSLSGSPTLPDPVPVASPSPSRAARRA